jgi:NitT/TauT family transport system ATP-binding protein
MSDVITTHEPTAAAPEGTPPKLAVRGLVKTRRSTSGAVVAAVDHVTFDVHVGEFVCLLGPSGCGKTSILNVLAGLDEPTSGEALLDGRPIAGAGPDRAVLFQEPALFPWLSVAGNVELALKLTGTPASERPDRARTWLSNVGLGAFADVQPHELSAGMRQRAQLARALATDPDVLLGDEPFGALDAQARELLQDEVQRVWLERGGRKTFMFVTHNVREAALLADRVLVMSAAPGRLLEEVRISAPRPRQLDDVLVARVVSDVHELLMREVDRARSEGSDQPIVTEGEDR